MIFLETTIKFRGYKEKTQAKSLLSLTIFLKNTNKISDNKEKGQVA
jgi:hypothetical protein